MPIAAVSSRNEIRMSELDQDTAQQPPKRAQFPLWFLLFVIPTVAGLGLAIYTNGHRQSQMRAELTAHQEVLHERIATLESEIALVQHVDRQIQERADRWKSADAVVDYLLKYRKLEGRSGYEEVSTWHESRCFFVQADEPQLHRLLKLILEKYPESSVEDKVLLLNFVASIPQFAPDHTGTLADKARQLAKQVPEDGLPQLRESARRIRAVFPISDSSAEPEESP